MTSRQNPPDVKSVTRVLDIFELLTRADGAMSLSDISSSLAFPKSSTHSILHTLARRGYLESANISGPFRIGMKVLELAGAYSRGADLLNSFPIVAKQLVESCHEAVLLGALDGREVFYLGKEDGPRPVALVPHVGKRLPAHTSAIGKLLLSNLPRSELLARFGNGPLKPTTPASITSLERLEEELARTRAMGYGEDMEEMAEGLCGFSAPVRNSEGEAVAGIAVSVPRSRVTAESVGLFVRLVTEAGEELSRRIGCAEIPVALMERPGRS